jgi:hypothetical protein
MIQDNGASAQPTGLSSQATEPKVSALRASIPCAEIAFTGTQRDMTTAQKEVLLSAFIGFREGGSIWLHNGDCIEADEYAGKTWRMLGGLIHLHPPSKSDKRAWLKAELSEPPLPYMRRNQNIANRGGALVATPRQMTEQPNGGTWFTIRAARARRIPVMIILPDGTVQYERWPAIAMEARRAETPQDGSVHDSAGIAQGDEA